MRPQDFFERCLEVLFSPLFGGGDLFPIGVDTVAAKNAWKSRAARKIDAPHVQAAIDALVLTVIYDGGVTTEEALALSNESEEIAEARGIDASDLREMLARARSTVDAALETVSPREDATRARRDGAARLVASIAATLTNRAAREIVFRTVVRIARGSSANPAAHEELLREFARAFDLDLNEER